MVLGKVLRWLHGDISYIRSIHTVTFMHACITARLIQHKGKLLLICTRTRTHTHAHAHAYTHTHTHTHTQSNAGSSPFQVKSVRNLD